jgi:hypothetical protein
MGMQAWGGSPVVGASATFSWFRVFVPVPAVAPATIFGATDTCLASVGGIRNVNVSLPRTTKSAKLSGLSSNFPYSVELLEVDAAGRIELGKH